MRPMCIEFLDKGIGTSHVAMSVTCVSGTFCHACLGTLTLIEQAFLENG